MTRQKIEEQIEGMKKASTKKFDTMAEFTHDDIDNFLVEYTNKNEYVENTLKNLSIDYR